MKILYLAILLALGSFPCRLSADNVNPILNRAAEKLTLAVSNLDSKPEVTFDNDGNTLIVSYLPQLYKIHGRLRTGEISKVAQDEIGPSFKGFVLRAFIQNKGEINQACLPQTLIEPYWRTDIDVIPIDGTQNQIFWSLSYGSRTDSNLLGHIRTALGNLNK